MKYHVIMWEPNGSYNDNLRGHRVSRDARCIRANRSTRNARLVGVGRLNPNTANPGWLRAASSERAWATRLGRQMMAHTCKSKRNKRTWTLRRILRQTTRGWRSVGRHA